MLPRPVVIRPWFRIVLLLYGALNAILYAGLLPLWEGFDEPFHYGYVEQLSRHGTLPVLGRTVLSQEVVRSQDLAPAAYAVVHNVGRGVAFGDYFRMSPEQRWELRQGLERIDPASALVNSQSPNYESHHAPLAYALLAPFDALWAAVPLPARVLRLRLLGALSAVLLLWFATLRLSTLLELPDSVAFGVVFVIFSSQMFYATVCHVANDWLAVPLFTLLLSEAVAMYCQPRVANGIRLAAVLAAGLLTKAYFLAAIPFVAGTLVACCRRGKLSWTGGAVCMALSLAIAAPWYVRNLVLYQNLAGMQETPGGTPFSALAGAALHVPWLKAMMVTARSSLWTGNNALWALSVNTIRVMEGLLIAALCVYLRRLARRGTDGGERVLLAGVACYVVALVYSTILTYWSTQGLGISPAPWYVQVLLAPGFCLLFIGLSHAGGVGRALRLAIVWAWTYVIAISYCVKLVPFYAGFVRNTSHLSDLQGWYARLFAGSYGTLDTAALLPPGSILLLMGAVVTTAVTLAAAFTVVFSCPTRLFIRH